MRYKLLGIKEYNKQNHNLNLLIDYDSEEKLRKFLDKNNLLVINLGSFAGDITQFGNIKIVINDEPKDFVMISDFSDIRKSYIFLSLLGFNIVDINYLKEDAVISNAEIEPMIKTRKQEVQTMTQRIQEKKEVEAQESPENIYEHDTKLEGVVALAGKTVAKAQIFIKKLGPGMPPLILKRFEQLIAKLNKLKLGSNEEKIHEGLEELTQLISQVEKENIAQLKENEKKISEDTLVTNIDIIREIEKHTKAKQIKEIGGTKTQEDNYYILLGKFGIYIKLLFKDIKDKIKDINILSYIAYNFVFILSLSLMLIISLYYIIFNSGDTTPVGHYLVHMGLYITLLFIGSLFTKRNNYIRNIIIFIVVLVAYLLTENILHRTFAL